MGKVDVTWCYLDLSNTIHAICPCFSVTFPFSFLVPALSCLQFQCLQNMQRLPFLQVWDLNVPLHEIRSVGTHWSVLEPPFELKNGSSNTRRLWLWLKICLTNYGCMLDPQPNPSQPAQIWSSGTSSLLELYEAMAAGRFWSSCNAKHKQIWKGRIGDTFSLPLKEEQIEHGKTQ